ncbi:uncharacterized protein LOC123313698 isoform X2 [Coccinella septempunctata]|uniref:uncharacterized protein LOC123313698 isoform X2 n=1 Tax=Coccinella septempunctata TaxID=41139 RepID=UPI001D0865F3|nr:uncharacterized protein LOC123313698 isoform X2 [Coccinella septempunctata]
MSFQNAKHNIYSTSRKICREVGDEMGVEYEANALDLIAELAVKKLSLYATDLEAFQKCVYCKKELVDNKHNDLQGNKPPEANVGVKRKRKTNT